MTEIELSVLSRQCLSRRIPDQATLEREIRHGNPKKRAICDFPVAVYHGGRTD